ncbi:hypothetical protein BU24DRAFT_264317 [Aaosphaeria arxii CBS 175.79]|uniref:RING-type domain-containing protein n=1 Tax=Aaosphaeria arxii CBS 175.79 TaxID=1450172 RepID=A0A6A5XG58_9PLEO|nr:uncharacterized protein BU24DRAFT_264317 [Aaosphaeria arxii CBS 175.79]KAF2011817.1 hypothetical protein BU24DRAFT_264317 [Aaosphaeria arxii CBS 175.79]
MTWICCETDCNETNEAEKSECQNPNCKHKKCAQCTANQTKDVQSPLRTDCSSKESEGWFCCYCAGFCDIFMAYCPTCTHVMCSQCTFGTSERHGNTHLRPECERIGLLE